MDVLSATFPGGAPRNYCLVCGKSVNAQRDQLRGIVIESFPASRLCQRVVAVRAEQGATAPKPVVHNTCYKEKLLDRGQPGPVTRAASKQVPPKKSRTAASKEDKLAALREEAVACAGPLQAYAGRAAARAHATSALTVASLATDAQPPPSPQQQPPTAFLGQRGGRGACPHSQGAAGSPMHTDTPPGQQRPAASPTRHGDARGATAAAAITFMHRLRQMTRSARGFSMRKRRTRGAYKEHELLLAATMEGGAAEGIGGGSSKWNSAAKLVCEALRRKRQGSIAKRAGACARGKNSMLRSLFVRRAPVGQVA